jgi:hypothetical protein
MSDEATPKPIDFSALDPSRDRPRWERTIQGLAAKAHAERRRRFAVEHELLRWARPVLAVAAAFCLIVWTAGYFVAGRRSATAVEATPPALSLAAWAATDQLPETSEIFHALGGTQ